MVGRLVSKLTSNSINVYHFGYFKEPELSENKKYYHNLTNYDFFNQIKISLGTKLALGTDSDLCGFYLLIIIQL